MGGIERKNEKYNPIKKGIDSISQEVKEKYERWKVKYLRESNDKRYDIYAYRVDKWWNKWWIIKKYIDQIWPRVEWTQLSNADWYKIKKDRYNAWEIVYLRVPKNKTNNEQKENEEDSWQVTYLRESTDKKYNIYRYKLIKWWNEWWIKNKYINQIWPRVEWTQFTDAKWNVIEKNQKYNAWEIVYLRVPNRIDRIDPIPEMSLDEILNMKDEEITDLEKKIQKERENYFKYKDKNWKYAIIKGKKVYLCNENNLPKHDWAYIRYEFKRTAFFSIFTKEWNEYSWVHSRYEIPENEIERGDLKYDKNNGEDGYYLRIRR